MQNGTRNRLNCVPADRPHDPGDAADLSIMGYRRLLHGSVFCSKSIICAKMKENQQILNGKISRHDSMVKSPVLVHVKKHPVLFYQKDNICPCQEFDKYITITRSPLPLRKAPALRVPKYDLRGQAVHEVVIVRSSFFIHCLYLSGAGEVRHRKKQALKFIFSLSA